MLEIARAAAEPAFVDEPVVAVSPPSWSAPRRVGFRFAFSLFALWLFPFPLGTLPGTGFVDAPIGKAWNALIAWFAHAVLHLGRPLVLAPNGSGDRTADYVQTLILLLVAVVGCVVWSAADRRRLQYARLERWLHVAVRFFLGTVMIGYGYAKVFHSQFPSPPPAKLEQPYGDASPMGLLWTFMGYSAPYNVFTGLCECVGGTLLFFRRTAVAGALVVAAVMTNVVMLNFCYDVPVKIFSSMLLGTAIFLAAPRLGALFDVLVRGRAVAAQPPAPLFARRRLDLAARALGVLFAGYVLVSGALEFRQQMDAKAAAATALGGIAGDWDVDELTRDGALVPATLAEKTRWKSVWIMTYGTAGRLVYKRVDDQYDRLVFEHDGAKKTLTIASDDGSKKQPLVYAQPDADHVTLTGTLDGHALLIKLRRRKGTREYRLVTRGFHWINEFPYNR